MGMGYMNQSSNKRRIYADFMLLIVAILWGSTFVATKVSLSFLSPLYILAVRFLIAFIIMFVLFWKKLKKTNKYDLVGGFIVGTVIFFAFLTQTIGLIFTTAGKQAFLAGTYVVIVPFLYWIIYKKRPDIRSFLGATICFVGISLLTLNSSFKISFGDSLTMFSSLLFAAHIISNGYFVERIDAIVLTIIQFGVAGVWALSAALIFEPIPVNIPLEGVISVLYLAVFGTCIAYFLQTVAQKNTLSTHAAIILSMEAVFGSIFSIILLKEAFTIKMVAGCVAILASILIIELKSKTN